MTSTEILNANKIMLGTTEASAIYIGSDLLWTKVPVSVPYDAEIKYLKSSGTQWIDTGITPNTNTKVQLKFKNLESTGDVIIGYYGMAHVNINDKCDWRLFNYNQYAYFDLPVDDNNDGIRIFGNDENSRIYQNTIYELELGNYYIKNLNTNTILISGEPQTYTGISTITLNHHDYTSRNSKNEFYYVKIYDGDTLVRDLIPVRVGQVGYMYDKISNTLFGNSGTGDFILGSDKTELPYDSEIEYLESTGLSNRGIQYIETGIIPDENTGIYIKVMPIENSTENDNYIVGCRNDLNNTRWAIGRNNTGLYYGYGAVGNIKLNVDDENNDIIFETKLNYLNNKKWYAIHGSQTAENTLPALTFTPTANIRLFGSAGLDADYVRAACRIYFVKITQGNNLIMDLIPVRKNGIGYMYDKISNNLFENVGTGTFILGSDYSTYDAKIEYLESTGQQYINLDYEVWNRGLKCEIVLQRTSDQTNEQAFMGRVQQSGYELYIADYTHTISLWVQASNNSIILNGDSIDENIHTVNFEITENTLHLSNDDGNEYTDSFNPTNNNKSLIQLFSHRGYYNATGRIYSCKIWDNNIMIYDLIPVRKNGVGYMFDKLSNKIFGNSANGDPFILGPDV